MSQFFTPDHGRVLSLMKIWWRGKKHVSFYVDVVLFGWREMLYDMVEEEDQ
jgi:hypothetical protein